MVRCMRDLNARSQRSGRSQRSWSQRSGQLHRLLAFGDYDDLNTVVAVVIFGEVFGGTSIVGTGGTVGTLPNTPASSDQ